MTIIIISWDSLDSVLLCFKYPSLLYTLSETGGDLVENFKLKLNILSQTVSQEIDITANIPENNQDNDRYSQWFMMTNRV